MPRPLAGLVLASVIVALAGCGRRDGRATVDTGVTPRRTLPADSVFILAVSGTLPSDTVVQLDPGRRQVVVMRQPAPEMAAFATLEFPDSAFTPGAPAEVRIKVRPDQFGLDITSTQPIREGTITFKYARHFEAPAPAVERYGRDGAFESRLAVGRLKVDGTIELLPTRRPASDNVSAPLAGAGSYVVAAPR